MEQIEKQAIAAELARMASQSSGNAIAVRLGVSAATISNINSGKWDKISEEMWLKVSANIRHNSASMALKDWNVTDTRAYAQIHAILADAQEGSLVMAVCGDAGCGKTVAAKSYSYKHPDNTVVVSCDDYWNRKMFLQELLRSMGKQCNGYSVAEMVHDVVNSVRKLSQPLIILDEADKLSDNVLYFFITLYNKLENQCGIVLMATDFLEKKIKRGLRLNKKGYKEIDSRIGRRCIELSSPNMEDVASICVANGIADKKVVKAIYDDCDNDIRRVRRKVFAFKSKARKSSMEA